MKAAVIGFDIGTSGLKAAVADPSAGKIVEGRTWSYAADSETEPGVRPIRVYKEVLTEALKELKRDYKILAIGMTTAMYSVCRVVDGEEYVYQWNSLWDRAPQLEPEMKEFLINSGCRVDTLFPGYKLYTLDPETRKEFRPHGLKDVLIEYLTGNLATDYSIASPFGLFDARKRIWNYDIIDKLGFRASDLPKAVPHYTNVGKVILPGFEDDNIIVAPGLGDGPSASYGCIGESSICGNVGTSMAIRTITNMPDFSDATGLWNFAFDDELFATGGISSNACTVFHWMEKFGLDSKKDLALYDPRGVKFFPWLHGERVPYWSSSLRGTFAGIQVNDGPEEFIGACLRAVAFTFCRMVRDLDKLVDPLEPIVMAGGGTNILPLMEIISGCTDHPLKLLENESYLGATGSAMSAARAAGIELHPENVITKVLEPTGKFKEELEMWVREADRFRGYYEV